MKLFNRMNFVVEGANSRIQPVFVNDVGLAIFNCIKNEETIGQTYDLGGPHTYTYEEIYEHFFHLSQIKPYSVQVKLEDAYNMRQRPRYLSATRKLFTYWLYPEFLTVESQDLVTNPNFKGFDDLGIKPISFGHKAHELVQEIYWLYNSRDESKREMADQ